MARPSPGKIAVFALILGGGCSEARETILRSRPEATLDAGADAGDPALTLGKCAGAATECAEKATIRPYVAGASVQCTDTDRGAGSIVWSHAYDDVDCPNPPCKMDFADLRPRVDGTLDVVGRVRMGNQYGDALWIAHLGADGSLMEASLRGYTVGTRLAEPKNYNFSGWDGTGNVYATVRSGDINIDRLFDYSVLRFSQADDSSRTLTEISNPSSLATNAMADGEFVTLTTWDDTGLDRDEASRTLPYRFDLSRYDASGRLVWNQTKLAFVMPATTAQLIDVDDRGGATVVLSQLEDPSIPFPETLDNTFIDMMEHRLVRLDGNGNVVWARDVPNRSAVVAHLVAPDGSMYRARIPWKELDAKYYEHDLPQLERLDANGTSQWVLTLPDAPGDPVFLLAMMPDGSLLLTTLDAANDTSVNFRIVSADGRTCERFTVACPAVNQPPCGSGPFHVAPDGTLYFPIGKIARPN